MLIDPQAQFTCGRDYFVGGCDGTDYLYQFHDRGGVEEVQANDILRPRGGRCHFNHRQARSCRSKDRTRLADFVKILKECQFHG